MNDDNAISMHIENIITAIQAQDNEAIAISLLTMIAACKNEGMTPDQINTLLSENGVDGGEHLSTFITEQYETMGEE